MLLNYFKLVMRLLVRSPFLTFINVIGLSVAFTVFFVLWQYSAAELKSDQFHQDHERIYRIRTTFNAFNSAGEPMEYLVGAYNPAFARVVSDKFAEVESFCRITNQINYDELKLKQHSTRINLSRLHENGQKFSFHEHNTAYADPNLFSFFSIPFVVGDPSTALSETNALVMSRSSASKYFGGDNPVGKLLMLNDTIPLMVTGVFEDLPPNTHLTFDLVMSGLQIREALEREYPFQRGTHCYIKVHRGTSVSALAERINAESKARYQDYLRSGFPDSQLDVYLQPLSEISFSIYDNDGFMPKSKGILQLFKGIAILVLVVAFINYLNLHLTTQAKRLKEFGTRKAIGATSSSLIQQFLVQTLIVNGIAILLSMTLLQLVEGPLIKYFKFYIPSFFSMSGTVLLSVLVIPVMFALAAGVYPALLYHRLGTRQMMSESKNPGGRTGLPEILCGFQYLIAFTLILWLFSVNDQIRYILTKDIGINRRQVIVIDLPLHQDKTFLSSLTYFQNNLKEVDGVADFAISTSLPGDKTDNIVDITRTDIRMWTNGLSDGGVDERFIPFYNINIVAGRNFLAGDPSNHRSIIISERIAEKLGLDPKDAVGRMMNIGRENWTDLFLTAEIIGVVEDYRHSPLLLETGVSQVNDGITLTYGDSIVFKNDPTRISLRIDPIKLRSAIATIEQLFRETFPGQIFHWYSLDDHINQHYESEQTARNQIGLFTLLAIGIACLGLLGVYSHKAIEKTKEIGIRKVLGAQFRQVTALLLISTMKQLMFAMLIAVPVAYYLVERYLQNFAARITLQWWHLVVPVSLLTFIMLLTISSLVWKAANKNPVEALKCE